MWGLKCEQLVLLSISIFQNHSFIYHMYRILFYCGGNSIFLTRSLRKNLCFWQFRQIKTPQIWYNNSQLQIVCAFSEENNDKNIYFTVFNVNMYSLVYLKFIHGQLFLGDECIYFIRNAWPTLHMSRASFVRENNEIEVCDMKLESYYINSQPYFRVYFTVLCCSVTKFMLGLLLPVRPNGNVLMCWHRETVS